LLAANLRPTLSVELGTCGGGGAFHMAIGWPDGQVIGVDHNNSYPENIAYVEEQCPNFKFMQGTIDLLFIDTNHTYQQTWNEFNAYQPYLAREAVVCLDDMFRPGMSQVWMELPGHKVRLDDLHHGGTPTDGGFGVLWF
jgi:predicted O-methyltransferase YrrM